MILVDAGPLVALFDPGDAAHRRCVGVLKSIEERLGTTTPVLTEAFHLLTPNSVGSQRLMDFIADGALFVWFLDDALLARAFELMVQYADASMDLADASLVATAESEDIRKIFTIDRNDFATYRIKRGHRHYALEVIG
ncbi:MAG TPA: PIN domain-containing protein [Gammaproteobacteria bacterium]|nr:PIN domain-containing protein [Gammaproteobacteria bacterium]